jgi:hypothetical protein
MVTTGVAPAGAVQTPVLALMVPALALQVTVSSAPPVTVVPKVVVEPTVRVGAAGLGVATTTVCGVTWQMVVAVVPAALVTVRVKRMGEVIAAVGMGTPLVAAAVTFELPFPVLPTVAEPPEKVGVRVTVAPYEVVLELGTRLVATGGGATVTSTEKVELWVPEVAVMVKG